MKTIPTDIPGLILFEPHIFNDPRGYFFESYSKQIFDHAVGYNVDFVQDNQSQSTKGVIRGLHYQLPPHDQAKLVRCILGRVLDVALDIRPGSPTFGRHFAVELSDQNCRAVFIPRGFAHGFAVLSENAVFQYKCDNYYAPAAEAGISPLDPDLHIDWQTPLNIAILSKKDLALPTLKNAILP